MDDTYQVYVNRVARLTLPETYVSQLEHIQQSPKYQRQNAGDWVAAPFPGYSIITPPAEEDEKNQAFYQALQGSQQQLCQTLETPCFLPVPPSSLHLTLADLIWDSSYRDAAQTPDFEAKLQTAIAESLTGVEVITNQPIRWQAFGLFVMPRALGVCLVPGDQASYEQIIQFRRAIYQNPNLMALGIEQQYHLTAHITLGYFGDIPTDLEANPLSQSLAEVNQQFHDNPLELTVQQVQLRKFDDMTRYYRQADWPALEF